eukprot:CAMPEP_0194285452 /NCGR_PEP_ID=MMETSP0169-20130528/30226_1 /TAXON_ID=218684 /ORGANISM="Corethron pennatum, Strain L29A3" /LENGTH=52 /DNA_ID=CAMNT_0039031581 /DNA_START=1 /DNA_END=156 /DNA_ORIENTATION=+
MALDAEEGRQGGGRDLHGYGTDICGSQRERWVDDARTKGRCRGLLLGDVSKE